IALSLLAPWTLCSTLFPYTTLFRSALRGGNPLTLSTHRLRRGLPGYLILFDPHAFAHQRKLQTRKSPSPLVFLHISAHFTATHRSEEHTSELQSRFDLVCRLLLEKK